MMGGWREVQKRNFQRWVPAWDSFPVDGGRASERGVEVVLVYFSEFLDHCRARNFFELFGCIGEVVEVVIAPRKDKMGKNFGFARFIDVEDARFLVVKEDNIIVEGKKIHTNLPRFERFEQSFAAVEGSKSGFQGG